MRSLWFITHPEVVIDPAVPVPDWPLSEIGRRRMETFASQPLLRSVTSLYASTEQKAIDGANILGSQLGLDFRRVEDLGENDRSSTGYLPHVAFFTIVEEFFAHPDRSVRGWETARHAQRRIVETVKRIARSDDNAGDIAIVSHGGVGALLLCQLLDRLISREQEQPGAGGGNYFRIDVATFTLAQPWRPIDA